MDDKYLLPSAIVLGAAIIAIASWDAIQKRPAPGLTNNKEQGIGVDTTLEKVPQGRVDAALQKRSELKKDPVPIKLGPEPAKQFFSQYSIAERYMK